MQARSLLIDSFRAALDAADARRTLPPFLDALLAQAPAARTLVVGAGKAAAAMAAALDAHWPGDRALSGLVVTRYGHGLPNRRIDVVEASHPVPDAAGAQAAARMLDAVSGLDAQDTLIALMSGGGSSLLSLPVAPVSDEALQAVTRMLLASGAPIGDINVVRKHLSRIQGGRLAAACRARQYLFAISDVPGDDLSLIASGPCTPDPSTFDDALAALARWRVQAPPAVRDWLERGRRGEVPETPKPGEPAFDNVQSHLVGSAHESLAAAAAHLASAGVRSIILGDTITGEARDVAQVHAAIVRELDRHGEDSFGAGARRPIALLSGGECSVTVRGTGRGGRNAEFLLALAHALGGDVASVWAIAADTDGIDGIESNAGAIISPDTLGRAAARNLDARAHLDNNDAYTFFAALDDLLVTGPTLTNVNDYRAILLA